MPLGEKQNKKKIPNSLTKKIARILFVAILTKNFKHAHMQCQSYTNEFIFKNNSIKHLLIFNKLKTRFSVRIKSLLLSLEFLWTLPVRLFPKLCIRWEDFLLLHSHMFLNKCLAKLLWSVFHNQSKTKIYTLPFDTVLSTNREKSKSNPLSHFKPSHQQTDRWWFLRDFNCFFSYTL